MVHWKLKLFINFPVKLLETRQQQHQQQAGLPRAIANLFNLFRKIQSKLGVRSKKTGISQVSLELIQCSSAKRVRWRFRVAHQRGCIYLHCVCMPSDTRCIPTNVYKTRHLAQSMIWYLVTFAAPGRGEKNEKENFSNAAIFSNQTLLDKLQHTCTIMLHESSVSFCRHTV